MGMNLTADERVAFRQRIEKVLSEILTDKYGEEYGVNISVQFVPAEEKKGCAENAAKEFYKAIQREEAQKKRNVVCG